MSRILWLDVSAGAAGDMILAALLDAGASLEFVRVQIDAVVPGAVRLSVSEVTRAGLRASKLDVSILEQEPPRRTWSDVRTLLTAAALDEAVRDKALAVFARLAEAEAAVHGIDPAAVHFHEVGALDAIADVVGACAALVELALDTVVAGPIALGSGTVASAHGTLPVPVPAVLQLTQGWTVSAGGPGELATPTGAALVTTLAENCVVLPPMRLEVTGVGAGTRDTPERANVVRAVLGVAAESSTVSETVLEANVDDLDPRLWPEVLAALLAAGARDAWLTPILMKKGRPAHTLHVLGDDVDALRAVIISQTSTFGVRSHEVAKFALQRQWIQIDVRGETVRIKIGHSAGRIEQATPEFGDVQQAAAKLALPVAQVLRLAEAAATEAGLSAGNSL